MPSLPGGYRVVLVGKKQARRTILTSTGVLLLLASLAFLAGFDTVLAGPLLVSAACLAVFAGWRRAGIVPTGVALWAVALWWFVFPPLVGYLTGDWTGTGRYTHPRTLGFAYSSARAELVGGIEYGLQFGLGFGVVVGLGGYAIGVGCRRVLRRVRARN